MSIFMHTTSVDATVFLDLFGTDEDIAGNRRLAYKEEESAPPGVTYLDGSDQRKVTDLLLEQVECSDIVLINKCDLLRDPSDIELVKKVVNPLSLLLIIYLLHIISYLICISLLLMIDYQLYQPIGKSLQLREGRGGESALFDRQCWRTGSC